MPCFTFSADVIDTGKNSTLSYAINPMGSSQIIVQPKAFLRGRKVEIRTSYGLPKTRANQHLASRLAAAICAGVAFSKAELRKDVAGEEYLAVVPRFLMRTLAADLQNLGY